MKRFTFVIVCLILLPTSVWAEEYLYVTDSLKATFRTGPGNDHKILRMVSSGEKLTVIEAQDAWTKVQLPNGVEGWMLNQWLTKEVPKGIQLEALQKKYENLLMQHSKLKQDCEILKQENNALQSDLSICKQKENDVNKEYEELKAGSGQFLELKEKYSKTKTTLEAKMIECDTLNDQLTQKWIFWTVTGAGILLIGIIMGSSSKRKRRHSLLD